MSFKRKSRNSTLMTRNYLDLGSACGWLKFIFQPIRSTIQIWVVTRHQYATFAALSFNVSHFSGKPEIASRKRLFTSRQVNPAGVTLERGLKIAMIYKKNFTGRVYLYHLSQLYRLVGVFCFM